MLDAGRHHQIAYVTNDLARARALFAAHYGAPRFYDLPIPPPEGGGPPPLRVALTNVGGVEVELIEPQPAVALYAEVLPKDGSFAIVFHHICTRIEGGLAAWERHRASLDERAHPVVFEGGFGDFLRFAYTDERARLGHYLEHVWMSPEHVARMREAVPHFPG